MSLSQDAVVMTHQHSARTDWTAWTGRSDVDQKKAASGTGSAAGSGGTGRGLLMRAVMEPVRTITRPYDNPLGIHPDGCSLDRDSSGPRLPESRTSGNQARENHPSRQDSSAKPEIESLYAALRGVSPYSLHTTQLLHTTQPLHSMQSPIPQSPIPLLSLSIQTLNTSS